MTAPQSRARPLTARSLKARWLRRLRKTHEVVLHAEAVAACLGEFAILADERGARSFRDVVVRPLFHWSALVLRGVCVEGWGSSNVSLGLLLKHLRDHAAMFLKAARRGELQKWLGCAPTEALIAKRLARDAKSIGAKWPAAGAPHSKKTRDPIKDYANSLAHPQLRERRMRGLSLRKRRVKVRELADQYQRMLSGKALDCGIRDRLIERFEAEMNGFPGDAA